MVRPNGLEFIFGTYFNMFYIMPQGCQLQGFFTSSKNVGINPRIFFFEISRISGIFLEF